MASACLSAAWSGACPEWMREGEAGKGLQRADLSLVPSRIRLSSGLSSRRGELHGVPRARRSKRRRLVPADAGAHPSLAQLGRAHLAAARHAQPERRPDQHPRPPGLPRLDARSAAWPTAERRFLLGVPVGVERDRTLRQRARAHARAHLVAPAAVPDQQQLRALPDAHQPRPGAGGWRQRRLHPAADPQQLADQRARRVARFRARLRQLAGRQQRVRQDASAGCVRST